MTETDSEKANVLNKFFASVFVHEDDKPLPTFKADYKTKLTNVNITTDDMLKRLKSLKVTKSSGPDGVSPKM